MNPVTLDGPLAAILIRDSGRLLHERGHRLLVPLLLGTNALIAYSMFSMPDFGMEPTLYLVYVILAQWLAVYGTGTVLLVARAGTCFGTERARDTWTLMRATPASPAELVLGNLAAAVFSGLILVCSQFPLLLPFAYCGAGATVHTLAMGCTIGLGSWIACAAWALWMSAAFRRVGVAFGATFVAALWATGFIPISIVSAITEISTSTVLTVPMGGFIVDVLYLLSPVHQLTTLVRVGSDWTAVGMHLAAMFPNTAIPFYFAIRAIRNESDLSLPLQNRPAKQRRFGRRTSAGEQHAIDEAHAIYGLERRVAKASGGVLGRLVFVLIGAYAIIAGFTFSSGMTRDPEFLFFISFTVVGMAIWRSAIGVSTNREQGTFDLLAMTGLRSHEIVRDLAFASAAALRPLWLLLALIGVASVSGLYYFEAAFDREPLLYIGAFLLTLALCTLMQLTCGIFSSVAGKGARESVGLSGVLAFIMYFGVPLLIVCLIWTAQSFAKNDPLGMATSLGMSTTILELNVELIAGCSTPYFGLLAILDGGQEIPPWTWFVAMGVGLAWTGVWYAAAVLLLQRRLGAQAR